MNKGLISSLCTLGILFALVLGNNSPVYTKTSDHSVESMPNQVNVMGIDKAGNSIGTMGADRDRDISGAALFDSYGLMGQWKSME
jgi:hypothetical protein